VDHQNYLRPGPFDMDRDAIDFQLGDGQFRRL
jgi:hypothetical protein